MTNESHESLDCDEYPDLTEQGVDLGRSISVETGSDSTSSSSPVDQAGLDIEAAAEWNSYIDSQKRDGWSDLGFDEKAFCEEYLENGYNKREAAVTAGRAASAGISLLHKPLCREYILSLEAKRYARSIITERFLEAQYMVLLDQANGDVEVPIVTGAGQSLNALKFDGNLKLAVLKELGLTSGVTKPDASALGGVTIVIDMGALTGADHKTKVVSEQ